MARSESFYYYRAALSRILAGLALVVGMNPAGSRSLAVAAPDHNPAPFPASASITGRAQADIFSYALESGFIRISFADVRPAAAAEDKSSRNLAAAAGPDKQIYGLIAIDLKSGWKTYWRNPGTSGFAPEIKLDGGAGAEILFPAPQLLRESGEEWNYGYKNRVLLPFRLILPRPQQQAAYSGILTIGICKTLCMPQKIPFHYTVAAPHNAPGKAELTAALAALPRAAEKNFRLLGAEAAAGRLRLTLLYPSQQGEKLPQLFLDGGDMQTGLALPAAGAAARRPGQAGRGQERQQIYEAPLLLGEAEAGAPLAYSAVLPNGKAVSGTVRVSAARPQNKRHKTP